MRILSSKILFCLLLCTSFFTACNDSGKTKTETSKVTTIPVTTANKEAQASFEQGLALFDQGEGLKAKAMFEKAVQQDPNLSIAHMYLAFISLTPKEFNDHMAMAKAHLDSASNWEKNYYDYVMTFNNDDREARKAALQKNVDEYPDAARAHADLGQVFEGENDFAKAREHYQKAIDLDNKWVGGYFLLGNSYVFSTPKDFKKAEEQALKAVELAPNSYGTQILLGDVYRAQNDLEKAKVAYEKAITFSTDMPDAYYKAGHVNSFLGKMDEARKLYAKAASLDPSPSLGMLQSSYTYLYAGDPKMAIQYLMSEGAKLDTTAANASKNNLVKINAADNLALIGFHIGDTATMAKAIAMMPPLASAIAAEVGTPEAKLQQEGFIMYNEALLLALKGDYTAAEAKNEAMKKSLDPLKNPRKLENYHFVEGYLAYKQNKFADAVTHFEQADQNDVYNKYWLAKANDAAGNKDKAKQMFSELSIYNFNNLGYALTRVELKNMK